MTHFKVDIQLPLKFNLEEGKKLRKKVPESHFSDTYDELMKITKAEGFGTTNVPIIGSFISPKTKLKYSDENTIFSVLIKSLDKVSALKVPKIRKLQKYKKTLLKRFEQESIYMVATRCTWL